MTKPSAERQRKLVAQRKQAGLKRYERWITPAEEPKMDAELARLRQKS